MQLSHSEIERLFDNFSSVKALVVGDVMIDAYLWGKVDRISPEAPVPIVSVTKKEQRLGGAANVALNLLAMGASPVICTLVGQDADGDQFEKLLRNQNMSAEGVCRTNERPTTVKTRIISANHHMLRVDEESTRLLSTEEENTLIQRIDELLAGDDIGVIVLEDYNKGVLTERVIAHIIHKAQENQIPVSVDPKKDNFFAYDGVTLFKPNLKELQEGLKVDLDTKDRAGFEKAVDLLRERVPHDISLVTLSEAGVFVSNGDQIDWQPAYARKIVDVSGAGDTVISVASLCLALRSQPAIMAALANLAGGQVCEKVGVVPVNLDQLREEAFALTQA